MPLASRVSKQASYEMFAAAWVRIFEWNRRIGKFIWGTVPVSLLPSTKNSYVNSKWCGWCRSVLCWRATVVDIGERSNLMRVRARVCDCRRRTSNSSTFISVLVTRQSWSNTTKPKTDKWQCLCIIPVGNKAVDWKIKIFIHNCKQSSSRE